MKKLLFIVMTGIILSGCSSGNQEQTNPFFTTYTNKYGVPPFGEIKNEHYMPALLEGMKQHDAEVLAIANNAEAPTFANTVEALDYSGDLLTRVASVFGNLRSSNGSDEMDSIAQIAIPLLSEHSDNIYLNEKLFERVKNVYDQKADLGLNTEQMRLLDKQYKRFVRSGANLTAEQKERLREINSELSSLNLNFGQNMAKETDNYRKIVEREEDLAGLPENIRTAAAAEAKAAGFDGKWMFTIQKSSFIPVLQYGENRELRRELLLAYTNRSNNNNELDNKAIIEQIINLRIEMAQMLGYRSYAEYILAENMAKTPEAVNAFLPTIWEPALKKAKAEAAELQKMMDAEKKGEKLEAWDWWFYTEKIRKAKFDLDEEMLRPYFKMENVRQGAFDLAHTLWGISFRKLDGMPLYHSEAEAFEVTDADGSLLGIFYTDYYPRKGKEVGAWMTNFREQYVKDGQDFRPIIINEGNFTKPTSDKPALLSMDEVETLFHEFGHALHGLLTKCTYLSLSGTNVSRDFVELPSQIMENWCFEPEVMKTYAFHYKTGEAIPVELIEKVNAASTFNQGFVTTEMMASTLLDMAYHNRTTIEKFNVTAFEDSVMKSIGMIPEIFTRYRSTNFAHIFSGGYAAGYYAYKWAEVLDADAYQAFVETGNIFNKDVATAYRTNILEKGDS
ncbi:MAG: M3 family metallopeptidase, partial [Cytophagaceae bacterium]|nr:M3 family metallopeptidase [Cytophagaceae bacterium]